MNVLGEGSLNCEGGECPEILEEGTGSVVIIIVCVVLIVLAALIAAGLVYYAKMNQVWCFKPHEDMDPTTKDQQKPLQTSEPPIVKPGYRRPPSQV